MTKEQAKRWLSQPGIKATLYKYDRHTNEALKIALKEFLEDDWIPCSKRLPEEDKDVLVTVHFLGLKQTHPNGWNDHIKPSRYVEVARTIGDEWHSDSDEYKVARARHKVVAWRPLPEPYKEKNP